MPGVRRFVGPRGDPDRHRLVELVHRGAEGAVWRAVALGESGTHDVAIKQLHRDSSAPIWRTRWNEQHELMADVGGPGCIEMLEAFEAAPPHGAGRDDGSTTALFEVSRWVEGRTFDRWAADPAVNGTDRLTVMCSLAAVIERLHGRSVIHRDIAPGNVIVERSRATLIDFGLATRLGDDDRVIETETIGTTGFRSPEAELGEWSIAADRWAVGALCRLALAGYESMPPHATGVITALLADQPGDRPPVSSLRQLL